jgi:hypothetical protein
LSEHRLRYNIWIMVQCIIKLYIYIYIYIYRCPTWCHLKIILFKTSIHVSGVSCPSSGDLILPVQP